MQVALIRHDIETVGTLTTLVSHRIRWREAGTIPNIFVSPVLLEYLLIVRWLSGRFLFAEDNLGFAKRLQNREML